MNFGNWIDSLLHNAEAALKAALEPEYDRLKAQAASAIQAAFAQLQADATSPTDTVDITTVRNALYAAVANLRLPSFVAGPIDIIIGTLDLSAYAGQAVSSLSKAEADLIAHIDASHL